MKEFQTRNEAPLVDIVRRWSTCSPGPEICALADAARRRHGGVAAVLFYGSCLRNGRIDEGIADLYLLVDDYHRALGSHFLAVLNRLLPPNVFYLETEYAEKTLRAKYAILTLEDFRKGAGRWFHSYIWGRFSQPSGLVYARDPQVAAQIHAGQVLAIQTFLRRSLPQASETFSARDLWCTGLGLSYRCELRSERPEATTRLFEANPDYYDTVTEVALKGAGVRIETLSGEGPARYHVQLAPGARRANRFAWRLRQAQGKLLSALRLLKALSTFANGPDYIRWKIERHSGERVEVSPALQRFPPLAICVTLWKLYRRGSFR